MKILKNLLLSSSIFALGVTSALAQDDAKKKTPVTVSDLAMEFSAFSNFQSGFSNQNNTKNSEKNVSAHRKEFAFFNETALMAHVFNQTDSFKYGTKIMLVPITKRKGGAFNGSHIYVESNDYGKIELGSPKPASAKMKVGGDDNAAGGAPWDRYINTETNDLKQGTGISPEFATSDDYFLDDILTTSVSSKPYSSEPSRVISYYTPKFEFGDSFKIQVGASYTPDSGNTGAESVTADANKKITKTTVADDAGNFNVYEFDQTVKDAFSGGIVIEQNISDGVDLKLGVSGQYGKAAGKLTSTAKKTTKGTISIRNSSGTPVDVPNQELTNTISTNEYKLKDLKAYNIGAVLNFGNFSYGASYGSLGKSLTSDEYHKTGKNTDYYVGTFGYKQGPFAASVSYTKTNKFKNTIDVVSIGADYLLAPGFKPYAQISSFTAKGKPEHKPELEKKKTRGTVAIVGAKLSL